MEYLTLNNGVQMPLVGLGTWGLRGRDGEKRVAKAISLGYRKVDTAKMYVTENAVGAGIKKSGVPREELFVSAMIEYHCHSYDGAIRSIDDSLQQLQLSYIDLVLLHIPSSGNLDMYRALEDAYRAGKARAIGISNFNDEQYQELMQNCSVVPMVNQVETHLLYQKWDLQELLQEQGTALEAWSPMGGPGCVDTVLDSDLVAEIAFKHKVTSAQVALRFLVQRGIAVISQSRKAERLRQNIDLFSFALTQDEMQALRQLDRNKSLHPWTEYL